MSRLLLRRDETGRAVRQLVLGLVLIAVLVWGASLYGMATASSRLSAFDGPVRYPVEVTVHLDFDPKPFHGEIIRSHGLYDGRESTPRAWRLRQVSQEDLQALSRLYWVSDIEPVR